MCNIVHAAKAHKKRTEDRLKFWLFPAISIFTWPSQSLPRPIFRLLAKEEGMIDAVHNAGQVERER